MPVTVGDIAPPFSLPGVADGVRSAYGLEDHRGRHVVLVFYPGDNTPICTRQLNAYTADVARFSELDADVLAISPQDLDSHEGFAADQGGFAFPLLADVDRDVARAYGVLGTLGFYRRSLFVVGPDGRLVVAHRGHAASSFPSVASIADVLASSSS